MGDAKGRRLSRAWGFAKDILLVTVVLAIATGLGFAVTLTQPKAQSAFDFSLDVRPISDPVTGGGSATTTVTATATSGSTRDIEFSCVDLPSLTACSFTPHACRPTCSAQLLLVTSASAPAGTHVVTVAASDGTVSRARTFNVTIAVPVPPPPPPPPPSPFDFSLGVNPGSGIVLTGGNSSTNVTANLTSGSTHAVQFSISDLPPDASYTFLPPTCTPTCRANLSVATSPRTPPGTYAIRIMASDGSVSRTAVYSLAVEATSLTTLTFHKGDGGPYSETDDASLANATPGRNYGANLSFAADGQTCVATLDVCRSVLSFPRFIGPNPGQVPYRATIISATLQLNVTNDGPFQRLSEVTESWTEATATWNSFIVPGTPRTKGPVTTFNTTLGWNVVDITGIVQNWADGDANLGVFLRCDFWNGSYYSSGESVNPPKLTVTFWSPPPALHAAAAPSGGPSGVSPPPRVGSPGPNGLASLQMRPLEATTRLPSAPSLFDPSRTAKTGTAPSRPVV